jgi:hypothetical protein
VVDTDVDEPAFAVASSDADETEGLGIVLAVQAAVQTPPPLAPHACVFALVDGLALDPAAAAEASVRRAQANAGARTRRRCTLSSARGYRRNTVRACILAMHGSGGGKVLNISAGVEEDQND